MIYHQRHARALQGASGLQARVFIHYAAGQWHQSDEFLATLLECKRTSLVKARQWLIEEGLLCSNGHTIPKWLQGEI